MTMQRVSRRAIGVLAAVIALAGCAAPIADPGGRTTTPRGRAAPPRGIMFVDGPMVETSHGWVPYRDVRAYRDGRLTATYYHRVLPARDRASASLLYDESARTARAIGGGPVRPFDPCPGTFGVGNYVELSPSGRWGLCAGDWSSATEGHPLVLFDPRSPRTSARAIFLTLGVNTQPAAWLDERRIAVTENRSGVCPRGSKGYDDPTGLAVIDLQGRVLERGPCVFSVVAGPRGLVLAQVFTESHGPVDIMSMLGLVRRRSVMRFSTDGGKTWSDGRPQFADADGKVFYQNDRWDDYVLYEGGKPTTFRDVHGATWARP
jgi:hypothetical protein